MNWHETCASVKPYLVRIETQDGTGTGFLFAYNETEKLAAVATALHVISGAHRWKQPLRLIHEETKRELFLPDEERAIDVDTKRDAASIVFAKDALPFPKDPLPMISADQFMRVGTELGWMGYPGVVYPQLCFFRGAVSAFLLDRDCYLIDGVAVNGVSGGPVFYGSKEEPLRLVGILSAYIPNPVGTQALPGLSVAQDISPLHVTTKKFRNMDDARKHAAAQPPLPPEKKTEPPQPGAPPATK